MGKRLLGWITVGILGVIGAVVTAQAQTNTIGFPSSTECPTTAPPINSGTDPGFPGLWGDPNRYGTGWDFYFTSNASQIIVYWYTYNAKGQPIWLTNGGSSTMQTATNGAKEFWAPLYQITLTPSTTTPTQTAVQVGQVAITFVPGSTTVAAIRWLWNAVGSTAQPDECVYDAFQTNQSTPSTGTAQTGTIPINESYTGAWYVTTQSGWGLDVDVGTNTAGVSSEVDSPLIYDTSGQAVWLQGTTSASTTAATSISLGYPHSKYPNGFPTSACTTASCIVSTTNVGTVTRAFSSSTIGTSTIVANVKASVTGGAAVAWPNQPFTNPVTINKLTDVNYVAVNQTSCQIADTQTTCPIVVAWASTSATAQVYRRNLTTNTLSTTPISTASSGQYTDNLAAASDVQYELHNNSSAGALLYQSAEVKVTAAASPTCTSEAPAATTVSSTATTQTIYAYGVKNATSVVFPTWWIPGGQTDIQWLAGTNQGNGTWSATVPLSEYDPGTPRYGSFETDVYMSNADYTNVGCGGGSWTRQAPAGLPALPAQVVDTAPSHDATTGTLAGQAGTSGGAATYAVPIVVPPGRAGMQPSLSLNYNSRSGDGVMGMGWTISGLSSIHRCPQTPEQDGQTLGVSYTDNDRLCLDGQRLVAISGTYGLSGAHYRTEVDSYADIAQNGGDLKSTATYFVLQERDGRVLTYGQSTNAQVVPSGASYPLSWLVQQIQDRVGNNQLYSYTNEGSGEVLLSAVTYTGFGTTAGNRTVTFAYEPRTNISGVEDVSSSYLAGGLTLQTQALKSVTTAVAGTTVRTYTPNYTASTYSGRLLMTDVQECATSAAGTTACHPATTFNYNDGALDYSFGALTPINQAFTALGVLATSVGPIADLDGDGAREYAVTANTQTSASVLQYLTQISANGVVQSAVDLTGTPFIASPQYFADVDGDGRAKLIMLPQSSLGPVSGLLSFGVWNGSRGVPASQIAGVTSNCLNETTCPQENFAALFTTVSSNIPVISGDTVYAADVNGDGKIDIIVVQSDPGCDSTANNTPFGVYVYLNAMNGPLTAGQTASFTAPSGPLFCLDNVATVFSDGVTGVASQTIDHIADFNGDGLPDFYITETVSQGTGNGNSQQFDSIRETAVNQGGVTYAGGTTLEVISKTCAEIFPTASQGQCVYSQSPGTASVVHWMDVNGDGLEDFVQATPGGNWTINLNQGGTLGATINTGSNAGLDTTYENLGFRYASKVPMMDVDGDGKPDLVTPSVSKGFALKMCTMMKVPPLASGECPTSSTALTSGSTPAVSGTLECAAYACPEEPGSTASNMPANGDTQAGYPYEWTDALEGMYPAAGLYVSQTFAGAPFDYSAYHLDMLKFVQTGAAAFTVVRIPTSLVSGLNNGASSGTANDVSGNGLASVLTTVGCPAHLLSIPAQGGGGTLYYAGCSVVGDGTHGPATFPDGTATSTFEPVEVSSGSPPTIDTTSILYGNLNQGVASTSTLAQSARTEGMSNGAYLGPIFPGLLNSVSNGLGDSAGWGYGSLALGMTICRDGIPGYSIGPVTNTATCQVTKTGGLVDSRNYYFSSSMPVVMGMVQSNGIGGVTGARSTIYGYNQAMYNHYGRGFEGFNQITNQSGDASESRQTTTVTTYNQEFPLIGKVACVHTLAPGSGTTSSVQCLGATTQETGQLVRAETDNYQCATDTNGSFSGFAACPQGNTLTPLPTGTVAFQPVLYTQMVQESDLATGGAVSHTDTTDTWDNYGNLDNQTVTRGDDATGGQFVQSHATQTTNTFDPPNTSAWWVNELQTSTVTSSIAYASGHTPPSGAGPLSETLTTSYTWNADRTPLTQTVQPTGVSNEDRATLFTYPSPSYGLPSQMQVCLGDYTSANVCTAQVAAALSPTRTTKFTYSTDGYFVQTTTNALSQATSTTHETNDGLVTSAIDPNGVEQLTTYDPFGRATLMQHVVESTGTAFESPVQIAYTKCASDSCPGGYGEDTYETYAAYRVTKVQAGYPTQVAWYDLLGREVKTAERGYGGTFVETLTDYDDLGTVAQKSTPFYAGASQYVSSYDYDALSRKVTKMAPNACGGYMTTAYTYAGRQTTITAGGTCTNSSQNNAAITMSRSTNVLGQYMQTVDAKKGTTSYWTEPLGHVMAMQDAEGNNTTAQYNALGQRTQSSDQDQGTWNFTYDALGELVKQIDARGVITMVNTRDALGRLMEEQQVPPSPLPLGEANEILFDDWIYDTAMDGVGELTSATRRRGTSATKASDPIVWQESYTYDTASRPITITTTITEGTAVTLNSAMGYDADGRPSTHTYPSGLVVQTEYGPYGQSGAIANATTGAIWYETTAEDAWGKTTAESYVDGTAGAILDYASSGQEETATWALNGTTVDSLSYLYDSFGNLWSQNRVAQGQSNTETYTYDPLQRLTGTSRTGGSVSYTYSASGNLLSKSDFGTSYAYAGVNSRSSGCGPHAANAAGSTTYTCDLNGNVYQSSLGALGMTYNADNQPRTAVRNGATDTWAYDANDQIDYQTASSGARYFAPGGYEQVGTTDIHELGPIIVTQAGSTTTITTALRGRLGSTIDTIDAGTPNSANPRDYDAFGATRSGNMAIRTNGTLNLTDTIHGFTQHEHADDVWLIHMGGRIYDYQLGRFLSVDPLIGNPLSSQSLNPYSYIGNNPLSGVDPTGYMVEGMGSCSDLSASCLFALDAGAGQPNNVFPDNGRQTQTPLAHTLTTAEESGIESVADRINVPGSAGVFDSNGHPEGLSPTFHVTPDGSYSNWDAANSASQNQANAAIEAGFRRDTNELLLYPVGAALSVATGTNVWAYNEPGDDAIEPVFMPGGLGVAGKAGAVLSAVRRASEVADTVAVVEKAAKEAEAVGTGLRNGHLAGDVHPKTGIPFDKSGYPDFKAVAKEEVTITQTGTRAGDFRAANEAAGLKKTPEGYTWHHHQDGTTMQLVPRDIHAQTGHTGGFNPDP